MRTQAQTCFHGGAFFDAVGDEFDDLSRRNEIVNADVLDAWFPPSPRVLAALREHLPWLLATSPPTDCGGMARVVARARGVPEDCVLPGAGSSALIFLAFTRWLHRNSRVLLLDPTYGEYAHVLERVVDSRVTRLTLSRDGGYRLDPERLVEAGSEEFDLIVLVNPNSPTGRHVSRTDLVEAVRQLPTSTRVWIDETYVEYVGSAQSLEREAAVRSNLIVCKSMSKVYALSGVRAAYLCASPVQLETLRPYVPPWAVSLPAQVAAVAAVGDPDYYEARYQETHEQRDALVEELRALAPMTLTPSTANFVLCELDPDGPTAAEVVDLCRERGVFLRDASCMGSGLSDYALRIAVKDEATNARTAAVLGDAMRG